MRRKRTWVAGQDRAYREDWSPTDKRCIRCTAAVGALATLVLGINFYLENR